MYVELVIDPSQWPLDLDRDYEQGLNFALGEFTKTIDGVLVERTPRDFATPKGLAKSTDEHIVNSWEVEIETGDQFKGVIGTDSDYGEVLDSGLYPGIGPRTILSGEGIFSRQAPKGMIRPILDDEQLIRRNLDAAVKALDGKLGQLLRKK